MAKFLLLAFAAAVIAYVLYAEYRKRLRAPIAGLIAVLAVTYTVPAVGRAVNTSPTTLMTFNWKAISFHYEL